MLGNRGERRRVGVNRTVRARIGASERQVAMPEQSSIAIEAGKHPTSPLIVRTENFAESLQYIDMPIRADLRPLYPPDWRELSAWVRFERAGGRCEECRRPHGRLVLRLPDGRWQDPGAGDGWISGAGAPIDRPAIADMLDLGITRVVLSAAHLDHDPRNRRGENLAALCQRCHLRHDIAHHRAQRRLTLRARWAMADLFDGPYSLAGYPLNGISESNALTFELGPLHVDPA